MRILLTGSEGFIASHLKKRLPSTEIVSMMDKKIGIDCSDPDVYPTENHPDVIIHLAATLQPKDDGDIRMMRTVHDYWKRSGARLIYTSSASIYNPDTLYAVQKLYGEVMFKGAGILRLFNVYGPGGSGIVDIIKNTKKKVVINGDGWQTRDFIHVDDVVRVILNAAYDKFIGDKDIGTGYETSINQLCDIANIEPSYNKDADVGVVKSRALIPSGYPEMKTLRNYLCPK